MGVTNAVTMPVSRSVTSSIVRRTLGIFSPMTLFANGEQGAWYDPSDLSTLYQDAAGTIPVTVDGQPVGRMEDKSGNGNHATQSVAASRPVYRTDGTLHWLEFDGVDDSLRTDNAINYMSNYVSVLAATRKVVSARSPVLVGNGGFSLSTPQNFTLGSQRDSTRTGAYYGTRSDVGYSISDGSSLYPDLPPVTTVLVGYNELPNITVLRRNGVDVATASGTGTLNFASYPLAIGRDGADYMNGHLYGAIVVSRKLFSFDRVEQYLATKAGVTFP